MELTVPNFFKTILPTKGYYAVAYKDSGTNFVKHNAYDNLEEFILGASNVDMAPRDMWFGLASFTQGFYKTTTPDGREVTKFRTQDNAQYLRSLFLDIDVGEDKPYKSTADALIAVRDFCVKLSIDVPSIVYSGSGGLHLYWALDQDIPKNEWRVLANALHHACTEMGLDADPARTRDCASILRCPATFNWKHALPMPVTLQYLAKPRSYDYYMAKLGQFKQEVVEPINNDSGLSSDWIKALDAINFGAMLPNTTVDIPVIAPEFKSRPAHEVVAQCLQMQQQDGAEEPVWRGMLATMRHCEGGIEMAHTLSKQDARYSEYDTARKLQELTDKAIAPYTCTTFDRLRPEVCHKCPHKGQINSPISVPVSKITTVQIDDTTGEVEKLAVTSEDKPLSIPVIETERYKVNETGCYVWVEGKGIDPFWSKFYSYPVYPIQRIKDRTPTNELEMSYVFRKHHRNGYDDFQVMGDTLMGQGINGFLGSVGFLLDQHERKHMAGFMIDLLKEVGSDLEETSMMDKLGWDEGMKSFLLGNKLYKTNGQVVEVAPKGYAADYSQRTVAKGSLEQWKKIANVYNKKGLEWGQMALASAFASPIMCMGSLERAALLFLTGEKGAGKSTALYLAVSVFGDPTRMLVNKDDTYLSRIAKLGIMSNISVGFDEMTDMSPKEASEMAYQITQGRGKDRMADGGKGIQHNKTFWSCLPIMSANDSIINALAQHSFDATAQMSRVLEVRATDINQVYTPEEFETCEMLVRTLPQNYGTAGDVYMRWVTANMDTVQEMIYRTEKLFINKTGLTNNYRFYSYMCTRMLVGIMIAKKLGLVDYDIDALMDYMVDLCQKSKRRIVRQNTDVHTVLGSFLAEHTGNRIVVTSDRRPDDKPFMPELGPVNDIGYVLQPLSNGKDLHIRVVRDDQMLYISNKAVKDWCVRTGVPLDKFLASINENGTLLNDKVRMYLGRQTQWYDAGRVSCLAIKLNSGVDLE